MHLSESGTECGVWTSLWLSALPCWCGERAGAQCRMMSECSFSRMSWSYYTWLQWMGGPTGCHYTFSTSTMLFRHQLRSGGRPGVGANFEVSHDHSVLSSETWLLSLSLSLSLWFVEIEQRTTVQSQFMLKSSTQIMFKQMQTKFVGKPLLHFPPNLIKTLKLIKTIVRFLEYEKRYFISNFNQMLK